MAKVVEVRWYFRLTDSPGTTSSWEGGCILWHMSREGWAWLLLEHQGTCHTSQELSRGRRQVLLEKVQSMGSEEVGTSQGRSWHEFCGDGRYWVAHCCLTFFLCPHLCFCVHCCTGTSRSLILPRVKNWGIISKQASCLVDGTARLCGGTCKSEDREAKL